MQAAFDAAPAPMLLVDPEGSVLAANVAAALLFGRPRAQLENCRLVTLIEDDDHAALHMLLEHAASCAAAAAPPRELAGVAADGRLLPLEVSIGAFDPTSGASAVVVLRDLSEQRRRDELRALAAVEAHDARERLEAMLEFAPAFILAVSADGIIEFINRTLPQYSKKDTIGTSWLQYFPVDKHETMQSTLRRVYEGGSTELYEISTPGPDGGPIFFEAHIAPVRVEGQTVGAVLVSQDVTERKRTQAELLSGRQMALLGTLAAGVAHEINTPIQFVGDSIEFLRDTANDLLVLLETLQSLRGAALEGRAMEEVVVAAAEAEEAADLPYVRENMPKAFDRCIEGLKQVSTIVHSLKEFAHPSDSEMVASDLNRAVQSSLTIATNEYKYVADLDVDLGDLPLVTCHANEIGQAVLNIVINAAHAIGDVVKGTNRKGTIAVRTRREGSSAIISIRDTGGGIPDSVAPRIFDPFFTTKEVGKGTGQGLAIAWSTVKERHAGELTFETKLGEGTTFVIRLPIAGKGSAA